MHLTHPIAPYLGIAPEDCFFAVDEHLIQMGMGCLTMFQQPEIYPDAPLHIYLQLDAPPAARSLLLGALLARAGQLRARAPQFRGRLYTEIAPDNDDLNNFFARAGFRSDDSEDLYHFPLPIWPGRAPVSSSFASVSLKTPQETQAFLQRLNCYRIAPLDADFLARCMQREHFTAVGFYRGGNAVCEALLTGEGTSVTLVSLYVRADYRRQGFAKAMLGAVADILRPRGVAQVSACAYKRSAAQQALMRAANAQLVRTVKLLPGMPL